MKKKIRGDRRCPAFAPKKKLGGKFVNDLGEMIAPLSAEAALSLSMPVSNLTIPLNLKIFLVHIYIYLHIVLHRSLIIVPHLIT